MVSDWRDYQLAVIFESYKAPVEEMINTWRQEQPVLAVYADARMARSREGSLFGVLLGQDLLLSLGRLLRCFGQRSDVGRILYGGSSVLQLYRLSDLSAYPG